MKKFLRFVTVMVVFAFCLPMLVACGSQSNSGRGQGETQTGNTGVIDFDITNLKVNLAGAEQLGIATWGDIKQEDTGTVVGASLSTKSLSDEGNEGRKKRSRKDSDLVFVQVDDEGEITEVEFIDEEEPEANGIITAGDVDLEILKMQVFGEFTAISYISTYWRDTLPDLESWVYVVDDGHINIPNRLKMTVDDRYNYMNNDVVRSYIIHNPTGKIYPTTEITEHESFNVLDGYIHVCSDCTLNNSNRRDLFCYSANVKDWYDLSVNGDGELELKDLLANKNIRINYAFKDMYGWNYVLTNSLNEVNTSKKIIYFEGGYQLASNGKVYVYGAQTTTSFSHVIIDGVKTPVTRVDNFENINGETGYMINGVYYYNGSVPEGYNRYVIGFDCIAGNGVHLNSANLPYYEVNIYALNQIYNIENVYSNEYFIVTIQNNNTGKWELYYIQITPYDIDNPENLDVLECELLLSDYSTVDSTAYRYTTSTSDGTKIYMVIMGDDSKPELAEYSSSSFESKTIVLQPLN